MYLVITPNTSEAKSIHAIVVCHTDDATLGRAIELDRLAIKNWVNLISSSTGLELHYKEFAGLDCDREKVVSYLKKMKMKKDDIVILYFNQHGYRTEKSRDIWPNLVFENDNKIHGLYFGFVNKIILEKKPKFLLSIADCCNNMIPSSYVHTQTKAAPFITKDIMNENMKKLFLNTKGSIIISSSMPGQFAYGENSIGAFFTMIFLDVFNQEVAENSATSWQAIIQNASGITVIISSKLSDNKQVQCPQHRISID